MKVFHVFLCGLLPLASLDAVELTFPDELKLEQAFPKETRRLVGEQSTVLSENERVVVRAASSEPKSSFSAIFSSPEFSPALDFIASPKTIRFANIGVKYEAEGGTTYVNYFGLSGQNGVSLINAKNAIFFQIRRADKSLELVQIHEGGELFVLDSWDLKEAFNFGAEPPLQIEEITLLLSDAGWEVNGRVTHGKAGDPIEIKGRGEFTNVPTRAEWPDFFIALQARQLSNVAGRSCAIEVESISID